MSQPHKVLRKNLYLLGKILSKMIYGADFHKYWKKSEEYILNGTAVAVH